MDVKDWYMHLLSEGRSEAEAFELAPVRVQEEVEARMETYYDSKGGDTE